MIGHLGNNDGSTISFVTTWTFEPAEKECGSRIMKTLRSFQKCFCIHFVFPAQPHHVAAPTCAFTILSNPAPSSSTLSS